MAKKVIQAQMQQRRDTAANWAASNPVLLEGELGIVTDDPNLYKIGDGVTAWNDLKLRGFDGTLVQTTGDSENAAMSQKAVTSKLTELESEVANTESRVNASQKALEGRVNAEIEEFKDAVADQVDNYKPIVINGNVTNAADEEDITSEDNLLKLKDRSALNGMGYVILRKNKTFAEQVTKPNTIYEIRYDVDLGGATHTIPSGCILKFAGGSIKNGVLRGNATNIHADASVQILYNVTFDGLWEGFKASVRWFGAKGNGATDDTDAIQRAIDFALATRIPIMLGKGDYVTSSTITINDTLGIQAWTPMKGISLIGINSANTRILTKINDFSPVIYYKNYNNGTASRGMLLKGIGIRPYGENRQRFDGLLLENSMGNTYEDVDVTYARNGWHLTTKKDTSISEQNTGYCEQNQYHYCGASSCINCYLFDAGKGEDKMSSFHGNLFHLCDGSANDNYLGDDYVPCVLNLDSGYIYNCVFNIKTFVGSYKDSAGNSKDGILIRVNSFSGTNRGTITYEATGKAAKIVTGDNGGAYFLMRGSIYGFGTLDWSDYKPRSVGEIESYNDKGEPISYLTASSATLGYDKIFIDNLVPPRDMNNLSIFGNDLNLSSLEPHIENIWERSQCGIFPYVTSSGSREEGIVVAGQSDSGIASRLIGLDASNAMNLAEAVMGWWIYMSGSKFRSYAGGGVTDITFNNGVVGTAKLNVTESLQKNGSDVLVKSDFSTAVSANGTMKFPSGLRMAWTKISIPSGQSTKYPLISDFSFTEVFHVQLTPSSSSNSVTNRATLREATSSNLIIDCNFEEDAYVYAFIVGK